MKYNKKEKALIYQINCIEIINNLILNIETLKLDNYQNKELISILDLYISKLLHLKTFLETVQLKTSVNISKEIFLLFEKDSSLSKVYIVVSKSNRKENPYSGKINIIV